MCKTDKTELSRQVLSPHFKVFGVRQGGILSPRFYDVYIDDLSQHLPSCNIGCVFGSHVINHISYADDLIIVCPSAKGLQSLITISQTYGDDHDIHFNLEKTVGMLIQPKNSKIYCSCDIFLNGNKLRFVDTNILELLLLAVSMMIMTLWVKCDPCISEGISSPENVYIILIMLSLNCLCLFVPICIVVTYGHLLRRALVTKFVLHIITVLECLLN